MDTGIFEELGFTRNETKVYLALSQLGTTSIGRIQKSTGLFAPRIYEALDSLIRKGLVSSFILNKKKHFAPAEPSRLKAVMQEKVHLIDQMLSQIPKISHNIPLNAIQVFVGNEGIKTIAEDELTAKTVSVLWGSPNYKEKFTYYRPNFHMRRLAKKVSMRAIFSREHYEYGKEFGKLKYTKVRFLPYELPITIVIYRDRFVITCWAKESIAIRIIDKELADKALKEFNSFWKLAESN